MTKEEVTLKWDEPEFDGGAVVTGYYIEKRQAYTSRWTKLSRQPITDLRYKISDLIEDEEYEFRVLAENEAGVSKPSETTGNFRARDPYDRPGKPGRPDITKDKDNFTLNWTKPLDDGRSEIFNYVVEMKAVKDVRWKVVNAEGNLRTTMFTVKNVQPDVDLEFRVSAENKAGVGSPSPPSERVTYG